MAHQRKWQAPDLSNRVAVVTGATRGVGRGIAEVLGECGATVFVTGRSSDESGLTNEIGATVEDVADAVTTLGGKGVSFRCDHADDQQIADLFRTVRNETGQLDILVNNVIGWGEELDDVSTDDALESWRASMWDRPMSNWDGNMTVGVRSHVVACREAIPLMIDSAGNGTIIFTSEKPQEQPNQDLGIDVRAHAIARLTYSLSSQLEPHRIASMAVVPGFPRTETVRSSYENGHPYFKGWTDEEFIEKTESVHFTGRAVAMLSADMAVMSQTGQVLEVSQLANHYGFADSE